jgi:hypothetical protein
VDGDPPGTRAAWIVCTAVLAAFVLAVMLYWPAEQAAADRTFAQRSDAEHTQACVNLGFPVRSEPFVRCIDELVKLQVRHEELLRQRLEAASLL